jgi:hypothetical protein
VRRARRLVLGLFPLAAALLFSGCSSSEPSSWIDIGPSSADFITWVQNGNSLTGNLAEWTPGRSQCPPLTFGLTGVVSGDSLVLTGGRGAPFDTWTGQFTDGVLYIYAEPGTQPSVFSAATEGQFTSYTKC